MYIYIYVYIYIYIYIYLCIYIYAYICHTCAHVKENIQAKKKNSQAIRSI